MSKNPKLEHLTTLTNRSYAQTEFLFNLVNCDYKRLVKLEWNLYNNSKFHNFVPQTNQDVEMVLFTVPKSIRVEEVFWNKIAKKYDS